MQICHQLLPHQEIIIVSTAGSSNLDGESVWGEGDWALYSSAGTWQKINNTGGVVGIGPAGNSRQGAVAPEAGDYTWEQIEKIVSVSSINDITDVDTPAPAANQVLKWNGSKWAPADDVKGITPGSVSSSDISDGTITDVDISVSAAISQSKVSGLSAVVIQSNANKTDITAKVNSTDVYDKTESDSRYLQVESDSIIGTKSDSKWCRYNSGTSKVECDVDVETSSTYTASSGINLVGNNLTLTNNFGATIDSSEIVDSEIVDDDISSSANIAQSKISNLLSDLATKLPLLGGTMTGALNTSTFGIKLKDGDSNLVTLRANAAMSADYSLILPNGTGSSGDVLSTDGSGNLSWLSGTAGTVTSVSGTLPFVSSAGQTPSISIAKADGATNGYLSKEDRTTFNNKQDALGFSPVNAIVGAAPVASSGGQAPTISVAKANGATDGYIAKEDWNTFNNKQNTLGFTPANKAGDSITGNLNVQGMVKIGRYTTIGRPLCNAGSIGIFVFDTDEDRPYVCTAAAGGSWKPLGLRL